MQNHPGSGNEFQTLVYIELEGGLDGAATILNVKTQEEIDLWCAKRPTLSVEYCQCATLSTDGSCSHHQVLGLVNEALCLVAAGDDSYARLLAAQDGGNGTPRGC